MSKGNETHTHTHSQLLTCSQQHDPNPKKETEIKIQEAQRIPKKMNPNRPTLRNILTNKAKVKERIIKSSREKQSHRQGNPHKAIS